MDHYIEVRKSTRNILKPISAMFIEPIPLMIFYGFETFENHQILENLREKSCFFVVQIIVRLIVG